MLPTFTNAVACAIWSSISEQKGFDVGPLTNRHRFVVSLFPVLVSFLIVALRGVAS